MMAACGCSLGIDIGLFRVTLVFLKTGVLPPNPSRRMRDIIVIGVTICEIPMRYGVVSKFRKFLHP